MERETLINFNPQSTEEKYLFAKSYIEELKQENKRLAFELGMVRSEIEEEFYTELRKAHDKIREYRDLLSQHQAGLIKKIEHQKTQIGNLIAKNRRLSMDNEKYFQKIISLQQK